MTAGHKLDLSDIDAMNISEENKDHLRQARIEADDIRNDFSPESITGWPDLLKRLENSIRRARRNAMALGGLNLEDINPKKNSWWDGFRERLGDLWNIIILSPWR